MNVKCKFVLQKKTSMNSIEESIVDPTSMKVSTENQVSGSFTIIDQKTINHPNPVKNQIKRHLPNESMAELFTEVLQKNSDQAGADVQWLDEDTVVINGQGSVIQNFILQAEALGKSISFTKQTVIKITD